MIQKYFVNYTNEENYLFTIIISIFFNATIGTEFGFEEHLIIPAQNNMIAHAQLIFGNGMIMVGSLRDDEFIEHQKPPSAFEGYNSQSPYIIVEDIDKHYNCAVESGSEVIVSLKEQDYGGKYYYCKDPEGFLWHF